MSRLVTGLLLCGLLLVPTAVTAADGEYHVTPYAWGLNHPVA